jgi:hypothetical protein
MVWYGVALLLSGTFVLGSLFLSIRVETRQDLSQVRLGWPLTFVIQDQSKYEPPLPWWVRFYSPLEVPTWVSLPQLVLSVLLVFGGIIAFGHCVASLTKRSNLFTKVTNPHPRP